MDILLENILHRETKRQETDRIFIASENFASESVRDLVGSVFTNKYAEGYPGRRYYNGCEFVDQVEDYAIDLVTQLYGCHFANVQPHSGANANTAVYQAFLKPGDKVLGMNLASGGHLSHGAKVNQSGKLYNFRSYGVDSNGFIDYQEVEDIALEFRPKLIVAGASAYPRELDWGEFRRIADLVGAYLMVDMAHYSGLIAGSVYSNPVHHADVVTSTTHKTLRGPRGGMILWNNPDYTKRINSAVFPGTQGGPMMNVIAAKAQCFSEALDRFHFPSYASNVIHFAQEMVKVFDSRGIEVITGGTDSHIILVDLTNHGISGQHVADTLERRGICVNKNSIPNDPLPPAKTSGIRIGTAAETTRVSNNLPSHMLTNYFIHSANQIADVIHNLKNE